MDINCVAKYYAAVGGLETAGENYEMYLENCYYAGTASKLGVITDGVTSAALHTDRMKSVYYLSHNAPHSDVSTSYTYGKARSDLQLRTKTTFVGWDFQHIWGRKDSINGGYPYLRCQYNGFIEDDADVVYVPLTELSIDPVPTLIVGDTYQLAIHFTPENATITKVTYQSADPDVCSVSETGLLTAISEGQTTISVDVTSEDVSLNKTIQVVVGNMGTNIGPVADTEDALTLRKIIYNGQVYILRGGKTYTIMGMEVK